MSMVLEIPADTPFTVRVTGPTGAAVAATPRRKVLLPLLILVGVNCAVTPAGKDVAASIDKATVPVNPPEGVKLILVVPKAPCGMLRLLVEALRVNAGVVDCTEKTTV